MRKTAWHWHVTAWRLLFSRVTPSQTSGEKSPCVTRHEGVSVHKTPSQTREEKLFVRYKTRRSLCAQNTIADEREKSPCVTRHEGVSVHKTPLQTRGRNPPCVTRNEEVSVHKTPSQTRRSNPQCVVADMEKKKSPCM